ncbi:MAG: tripartite tricarboxylate transporter substrate binding protein [Pseudomonadota bacterium]
MKAVVKSPGAIMLVAAISLCCGLAAAQSYPVRPVRLIVAFAPGGAADIIGRIIAAQLSEQVSEQIVVDNRGGAGGVIGTEIMVKAKPDGYTLLLFSSAHAVNPSLYKLPYDPVKDLIPIARMAVAPSALVVHPSVPVNSVKDLVALAKKKPGKLDFASGGVGSFTHLATELFRMSTGIDFVIVQYKGVGPAVTDLLGGHTQASISTLSAFMSQINAGRLKVLGIGGTKRSVVLPDVPTIAEAGVPGYEASPWFGIAAPAGTPQAIVDKLNKELAAVAAAAEAKKRLLDQGAEVDYIGLAGFGPFVAAETAKWARVVKQGNVKAQ